MAIRPPPRATGLYHFAIRYASRRNLAAALERLLDAGVSIEPSSDCGGIADSLYLRDPDQKWRRADLGPPSRVAAQPVAIR